MVSLYSIYYLKRNAYTSPLVTFERTEYSTMQCTFRILLTLLVLGIHFNYCGVRYLCIVKGDNERWTKTSHRVTVALPGLVINLPVFLFVAGVTLMEISEVHRKVHLELEENVSPKERWEQFSNCAASPLRGFEWQRRSELVAQAVVPQAHTPLLLPHAHQV